MKKVCEINDIVPETGVCALIDGMQVAVFRTSDDKLFAIDNHDPFSATNVLSRGLIGNTEIDGEDVIYVASPIYKQRFNLATGECLDDASVKVNAYPVTLEVSNVMLSS